MKKVEKLRGTTSYEISKISALGYLNLRFDESMNFPDSFNKESINSGLMIENLEIIMISGET